MHDHPVPAELEPFVESRQLPPDPVDIVMDSPEERALRAAFLAKQYLDRISGDWPWVP